MLGASLSYAVGAVYTKRALAGAPPMALAIGQQTVAAALMLPLAASTLPGEPPSPTVVAAVLALALLCTAVAYLLYFYLIENAGPTATSTVTLVVPVFGLIFGVVLLGEPVGIGTIIGLLTVLLSVSLVVGVRLRPVKA
jgi:drug/metabolite transporter (DMT)-like permease